MSLTLLDLSEAKIKAAVVSPSRSLESINEWADVLLSAKTASGQNVTPQRAMRCSMVLACIRALTEDVPSLPFILKRKTPKGAAEAIDHPAYRILKTAPNPLHTAFELYERLMLDFLLTGSFFAWQVRDHMERLYELYPLKSSQMTFQGQLQNGELAWNNGDPNFKRQFTHSELWRGTILGTSLLDAQSIIMLSREAIGLALAAEEQGARLFSQGIQTDLTLETPDILETDQKDNLISSINRTYSGSSNAWRALLLENGVTAKKIGLTAQESQYMEARNHQAADIARAFRMPGVVVGLDDKTNTFAAAEQFFLFYRHTLSPWTIRLEQTADRDLIRAHEPGLFTTHNFSRLLRADTKSRYEAKKLAIEGGFMTPEEAREDEDWNKLEGLDYTLAPANYTILRNGKPVVVAPPAQVPGQKALPEPKPNGKPAQALAERIADSIIKTETREFARHHAKGGASEAQLSNFAGFLADKVQDMTGASPAASLEYVNWRMANPNSPDEARTRLISICLEVTL